MRSRNGTDQKGNSTSWAEDKADVVNYFITRADGIEQEIERLRQDIPTVKSISAAVVEFKHFCWEILPELQYEQWLHLCQQYRSLIHLKANVLNEVANVARTYESMDEFWSDAEAQTKGLSQYTFWDVYEHGRRRKLEKLLAHNYGIESALLLNSGMSAIASVIGMLRLRVGDKILTGNRCYFETSEYLEKYIASQGVEIVRVPVNEPITLLETLEKVRPKAALFETVTIVPSVPPLSGFNDWFSVSPETIFMIDNSVQSYLTHWFDIIKGENSRLLVVESATKYLNEYCMAGVVYGKENWIEEVRNFARATGQQLQEKAFNYICEADIESATWKLDRHSRNVSIFKEELSTFSSFFQYINSIDAACLNDSSVIFRNGTGALIFLALAHSQYNQSQTPDKMHRHLLDMWRSRIKALGMELPIRAGYGWSETVARVYESGKLNQSDSPVYLRISIGIEPHNIISSLAQSLGEAAQDICKA